MNRTSEQATQTTDELSRLLSLEEKETGLGITSAITIAKTTKDGYALLENLLESLNDAAKDRITSEHLDSAIERDIEGDGWLLGLLFRALDKTARDKITSRHLTYVIKKQPVPVRGDNYLLNFLLEKANIEIITSEHLDFAVRQATTKNTSSLLHRLFQALDKTAGNKITTGHLSIAINNSDCSILCLLLKTLGKKVEENEEIKSFLKKLFLEISDEKPEEGESKKDFASEFLNYTIEENENDILELILNISGENAKT